MRDRKLSSTCNGWKPIADFSPGGKSQQTASDVGVHCDARLQLWAHRRRICQRQSYTRSVEEDGAIIRRWQTSIYETKQAAMRDCGREYATHEKSLARKISLRISKPAHRRASLLRPVTITMKKVDGERSQPDGGGETYFRKFSWK